MLTRSSFIVIAKILCVAMSKALIPNDSCYRVKILEVTSRNFARSQCQLEVRSQKRSSREKTGESGIVVISEGASSTQGFDRSVQMVKRKRRLRQAIVDLKGWVCGW